MAGARTSSNHAVDLLFDARHVRQSGIGTYIRTQLPHLQEAAARHRITLAVLADPDTTLTDVVPHFLRDQ